MKLTDITEFQAKGNRSYMEDFYFVSYTSGKGVLIGVFDGHGGESTAAFCGTNLDGEFDFQINNGASEAMQMLRYW
jgi:serine/threonine protein phosphatase PrpC